jgi:pyruvate dehydrogenase E2 component (dihydrolipoamide acetyltransferase)
MATNVILPALGMAQETGKIVQWLRHEGDQVTQGDSIAEIETDKVTVELEAPATGTLARLSAAVGEDVPVGQVIAVILAPGEMPATTDPGAVPVAAGAPARDGHSDGRVAEIVPLAAPATSEHARLASPKAKRIAAERGIDLAALRGSGPNGVVVAADVLAAPPGAMPAATPQPSPTPETTISTAWRVMAERTTQSWTTVPHFFLLREVEATALQAWYAQAQQRAKEKLTYTDLLVKIVAAALQRHPRVNASWQNGAMVPHAASNIGIAVAVPDGLLVPVIAHAEDLSLNAIARQRRDLVDRAQAGKLRPEDLQGGTFTISNLGMYGIDAFTAIINAPQAAILAVGALADRVVAREGQPVVRPILTVSLSCDHRVIDGARGAQFLATIADYIADPSGL